MNRIDLELLVAAEEGHSQSVIEWLEHGADVNAKDDYGWTPLHWASTKGHVHVAKELLEHGADIEATNNDGSTPLHWACLMDHVAVGNELLSRGANIEAKSDDGGTPLHFACARGHLPVVKALLSGGANILAANDYGDLPIHKAVKSRKSEVSKYLLQMFYATTRHLPLHELLKDLTWIGDPNSSGAPPLRFSLHRNVLGMDDVVEILEYLFDRDPAVLRSRDSDGSVPLHVACRRGASFAIVQSLVNLDKATVKKVTPQGDLPLFLACEFPEPSLDTIFLLMKIYPDLVYR
jgi:ankyrin repeat protein